MIKVVIDTSVLISALIGKTGPARAVLRACLTGKYNPLMSTALFLEYEDVSHREDIRELCPLSDDEINQLLAAFYAVCDWVPIHYLWRPNLKDEGDNFLIEAAVAGGARYIVTNNIKDLMGAELKFRDLHIVKPEQMLRSD
ncbi:putative toxin-antitoxin system toxin component, PIN family [Reinekea marinisedimentorum]|uniref:Putative PIN family toxin of toxin-antitoxin system n=1 Tax=Reinekea marinisedimentorum TaxID=230495 RepID=A0A4R3IC57_9GAMM|nr:putative toxin-antitoxin system toxin component, PIN family [Reinekea marinisedimentorum]TCS43205.1 putative PIN family toxin of toxin-antitoxin system [Reinekea marinisedimentorum]